MREVLEKRLKVGAAAPNLFYGADMTLRMVGTESRPPAILQASCSLPRLKIVTEKLFEAALGIPEPRTMTTPPWLRMRKSAR